MKSRKIHNKFECYLVKLIYNDIFWLLLICFTIRNILQLTIGNSIYYNSDSATYWLAAQGIFEGIIDEYRTPLYPIALKLLENINKNNIFENTIIFQRLVSFLSIIPFYLVCKRWYAFKPLAFLASLIYACQPWVLKYNHGIYAESLLVSLLVFFLYFLSLLISKPTALKWAFVNIFVFIMIMLKPLCIIIYGMTTFFGLLFLSQINKQTKVHLSVWNFSKGFLISTLLLLGYCTINKEQNDYFGISTVSHDNNFANIILSESYKSIPDKKLVSIIDTVKEKGYYFAIYYLNNYNDKFQKSFAAFPPQYALSSNMMEVKKIPENNMGYNRKSISPFIKKAMLNKSYICYLIKDIIAFSKVNIFYLKGYLIYMLMFIYIISLLLNLNLRKETFWMRTIVFLTTAGILFASIVGGINDGTRIRVLVPLIPLLIYLSFDLLNMFCGVAIDKFELLKPSNQSNV